MVKQIEQILKTDEKKKVVENYKKYKVGGNYEKLTAVFGQL